ncbi:hypothetical protein GTP58_03645 [Duganella sp. CY15W]|uniref:hypothetical protein n=1 Tax=Duganella sp. CY15W TaxID=2692172 RepID=UPI001367E84B|nr:hypothetical protein [Duganella sp. CY15W]MYM27415.1 hypothetical protein [Duganella sp. CY15W]
MKLAIPLLAFCLSSAAYAQQTNPDPAVKTANGKAAHAKSTSQSKCAGMQGGVDASGGESVEMHAKSDKATAANSKACGKDNRKADSPSAAPTTPNPEQKDPVLK